MSMNGKRHIIDGIGRHGSGCRVLIVSVACVIDRVDTGERWTDTVRRGVATVGRGIAPVARIAVF